MHCRFVIAVLSTLLACASTAVRAQEQASPCEKVWKWLQPNCEGARQAWKGNDWDGYLFGYAHHGRGTYTEEKLATLNENAWGAGIGKHFVDANGRTHMLYAAEFQDSHYKPEWMVGYAWLAHWRPFEGSGLRLGGGYTAFVTTRSDYDDYRIPVPGILPTGEIAWDRVSIMATYVPRLSAHGGNGDVLMIFGRIAF